jgi:hypothetical protein
MADQDDQTKQAEDPKTDEAEGKPKGAPDWQRAAEDYKAQRDAARKQSEELTSQLTDLKTSVEGLKSADDVQKAVDAALEKANAGFEDAKGKWAQREKSLVVGSALAQAGCIDSGALLSHVDMSKVEVKDGKPEGVDVKALQGSYPYLFGKRAEAGSTGMEPAGASDGIGARIDSAFGVKGE